MTVSLDYLEQVLGAAMWPSSLQTAEFDVLDDKDRVVDVPVVDSAVNQR